MPGPRVSLDQWRSLIAVVDEGGYAKAAQALNKSQSSVTYAVKQLESQLGVQAFRIEGRKAALTATGQLLYRRGKTLVDDAERLERAAGELAKGWETEIRLAVDMIFPTWLLVQCIGTFAAERPETRIELYETVLSGTDEMLLAHSADFVIASSIPQGFIGDLLMQVHAVCVAAPSHPLHHLGRPATLEDLRRHRHLVVRDSGIQRARSSSWLNEQRWTVSHKATSIHALALGYGYAWVPDDWIRGELERGALVPVPLREGGERARSLYLVYADRDATGPGALRLAEIIRESVAKECKRSAIPA